VESDNYLPFQKLFNYLRNDLKIELDVVQYEHFVYLFLSNQWYDEARVKDKGYLRDRLKSLIIAMWIPKQRYVPEFEKYYHKNYRNLLLSHTMVPEDKPEIVLKSEEEQSGVEKESESPIPTEEPEPKPPVVPGTPSEPLGDIPPVPISGMQSTTANAYLNFENTFDRGIQDVTFSGKHSALNAQFIFSEKHQLPVSNRKALTLFRHLNSVTRRSETDRIAVKDTVSKVVKDKYFTYPIYEKERRGDIDLLLIIEHGGPMIAFQSWWKQIRKVFKQTNDNTKLRIFFYSNYPTPNKERDDYYLYYNLSHSKPILLRNLCNEIHIATNVFFFSDAGVLDSKTDMNKLMELLQVIRIIKTATSKIVWLNPMQKADWSGKLAEILQQECFMVPYSRSGISDAVKYLK